MIKRNIAGALVLMVVASAGMGQGAALGAEPWLRLAQRPSLPAPPKLERVVIHTPSKSLPAFPLFLAEQKGLFHKERLDVQIVLMKADLGIKALVGGSADYSIAFEFGVRSAVSGAPVKGVLAWITRPLHLLMARPEIRSVKELKGKTIGIASIGGTMEHGARLILRHAGLDPDRDVRFLSLSDSAQLPALQAGSVAAGILGAPHNMLAKKQGFVLLADPGELIEQPLGGLSVTDRKLREQAGQVKGVIRASLRAVHDMKSQRQEVIRILTEWLKMDREVIEGAYELTVKALSADGTVSDLAVKTLIDIQRERLGIKPEIALSQVVDWQLVRQANEELKREGL